MLFNYEKQKKEKNPEDKNGTNRPCLYKPERTTVIHYAT